MKQERIRQDRQRTGEGNSKQYKQVSHGATLIFDDVFNLFISFNIILNVVTMLLWLVTVSGDFWIH